PPLAGVPRDAALAGRAHDRRRGRRVRRAPGSRRHPLGPRLGRGRQGPARRRPRARFLPRHVAPPPLGGEVYMLDLKLTESDLAAWSRDHMLVVPNPFSSDALARLRAWTEEVSGWPEAPGKWMKYFESSARAERQLCRVENFIPFHEGFAGLLGG